MSGYFFTKLKSAIEKLNLFQSAVYALGCNVSIKYMCVKLIYFFHKVSTGLHNVLTILMSHIWDLNCIMRHLRLATLESTQYFIKRFMLGWAWKLSWNNLFWRLLCAIGFHKKPSGGDEGYSNSSRQPDTGLSLKWSQSSRSERKLLYMMETLLQQTKEVFTALYLTARTFVSDVILISVSIWNP